MNSEFLKALIQLLAQYGGTFTCPLSELQQLGLELSLQNISSDNAATLTLRLGARIYYVPSKEAIECPTPTNPPPQPTGQTKPTMTSPEVLAVNTLNNRAPTTKSDLDLYLLEQDKTVKRTANARRQAQERENSNREYPWQNRKQ